MSSLKLLLLISIITYILTYQSNPNRLYIVDDSSYLIYYIVLLGIYGINLIVTIVMICTGYVYPEDRFIAIILLIFVPYISCLILICLKKRRQNMNVMFNPVQVQMQGLSYQQGNYNYQQGVYPNQQGIYQQVVLPNQQVQQGNYNYQQGVNPNQNQYQNQNNIDNKEINTNNMNNPYEKINEKDKITPPGGY